MSTEPETEPVTTTEPAKPERVRLLMVYVADADGTTKTKRGKDKNVTVQTWVPVTREEYDRADADGGPPLRLLTDRRHYEKLIAHPSVGAVYEFNATPDGRTVYGGNRVYVGLWPDDEIRADWAQEIRRYRDRQAQTARIKRDKGDNPLYKLLGPVKKIYDKQIGDSRTLMLARIISFLHSGKEIR